MPKASLQKKILENTIQALRDERIRKNLSMNRLAARSGVTAPMISFMERGMRGPSLEVLLQISIALEVDLWKILKEATEKAKPAR